jgi:hypothetical protein
MGRGDKGGENDDDDEKRTGRRETKGSETGRK